MVERNSAILDYPNELSSPLNADHHNVCKYMSRHDANYVNVRNVIKSLVERFIVKSPASRGRRSMDQESFRRVPTADELISRLGVAPRPTETLDSLMLNYVPGSCDWILSDDHFTSFMADESSQPSILHITGRPGSGKSVLASFLIQHLEEHEFPTQFWYFRHDDQLRKSNRQCLISLVFQTMSSFVEYSHRLLALSDDIDSIARSDVRTVWQKLLLNILNKLGGYDPIYWIIDAIDESESAQVFLGLLGSLKGLHFPLRVIFLTRTQTVTKHLDKLKTSLPVRRVSQIMVATPSSSLELFVSQELEYTPWPDDLKATITGTLLRKSQGNFLWLSLVMSELVNCNTAEELEQVLDDTPWELLDIYHRIEESVARDLKPTDAKLVNHLLSWVVCSERQLSEDELREALKPSFSVLNMRHTLSRLCGDFVVMDKKGNVAVVHYTAKEFLTKSATSVLAVDQSQAHKLVFSKCLSILTDPRFRIRLKSQGCVGLIRYCCLSWSHHMARSDEEVLTVEYVRKLAAFFRSSACLSWIDAVATTGQLVVLTSTSKALAIYLKRVQRVYSDENPLRQPLLEVELLSLWSTELVRIVGKFATHLLQYPSCIYSLVPLFCPKDSAIGRQFPAAGSSGMRVTGLANTGWDDCLTKFIVGQGQRAKAIYCLDSSFAILTSDQSVLLYSDTTIQHIRSFRHHENIVVAHFSQDGTMLITCGIKTMKVWDTLSARALYTYANPKGMRALSVSFSEDCSEIIVCCVDSKLRRQLLSEPEDWLQIDWQSYGDTGIPRGRSGGTPICTSFSPDGSKVVVAFRTAPMAIWGTESGNLIGRLENRHSGYNVDYPVRLTWNPATEHVVGIFNSGTVFKWYPLDQEHEAMDTSVMATEVACSPDGRLVVTSQRDGSLKIFSFDSFTLLYNLTGLSRATAMALSPDGRRIYDIRRTFCNVWEPNTLIRMAEEDEIEKASDTASSQYDPSAIFSVASEASALNLEPVTAIGAATRNHSFAFGSDDGTMTFSPHGLHAETKSIQISCGLLGITCLAMSGNGAFVATASMDRKVTARRVLPDGSVDAHLVVEAKSEYPVSEILFDQESENLVVICQEVIRIWTLSTGSLRSSGLNTTEKHNRWITHPFGQGAFISIGPRFITVHDIIEPSVLGRQLIDTSDVDEAADLNASPTFIRRPSWGVPTNDNVEAIIEKVFVVPGGSHIFVQTSKAPSVAGDKREVQYMLLETRNLVRPSTHNSQVIDSIPARPLPRLVRSMLDIPLGFVVDDADGRRGSQEPGSVAGVRSMHPDQRYLFAFIDHDFWVRTWCVNDEEDSICKRHFFLPRDWVNMECLELAQVTVDGRFLCPRNGEVAVVHNGLKGPGWME